MPINQDALIPAYCKNCQHKYVCSIQANIKAQDTDVEKFNTDNANVRQSVSTTNYVCRYKLKEE